MLEVKNGVGLGGVALAVLGRVSLPAAVSVGRRETYTFRKVIVEAFHLGTMADSNLIYQHVV
jgi:hypothetical protein